MGMLEIKKYGNRNEECIWWYFFFVSKLKMAQERVSEPEKRWIETPQTKMQEKKEWQKENSVQ